MFFITTAEWRLEPWWPDKVDGWIVWQDGVKVAYEHGEDEREQEFTSAKVLYAAKWKAITENNCKLENVGVTHNMWLENSTGKVGICDFKFPEDTCDYLGLMVDVNYGDRGIAMNLTDHIQ